MNIISFIRGDDTLTPALKKQREVLMYLIFGVLTTVVNFIAYCLMGLILTGDSLTVRLFSYPVDLLMLINNTIAWIVAVTFAFLTNRAWVFCSKGPFIKEMFAFFAARIVSLILFELLLFAFLIFILEEGFGIPKSTVFLTFAGLDLKGDILMKIINSVFVIVSNYFFSKWFIFTRKTGLPVSDNGNNSGNDNG